MPGVPVTLGPLQMQLEAFTLVIRVEDPFEGGNLSWLSNCVHFRDVISALLARIASVHLRIAMADSDPDVAIQSFQASNVSKVQIHHYGRPEERKLKAALITSFLAIEIEGSPSISLVGFHRLGLGAFLR